MTTSEYIRWLIATRHRDCDWLKDSTVRGNPALRKLIKDTELPALESVARHLAAPETMPPITAIWYRWILATLPTYQNNPRINGSANDATRRAATQLRDYELAQIREAA